MKKKSRLQSPYLPRVPAGVLVSVAGVALVFLAFRNASAQGNLPEVKGVYRGLAPVVKFDVSPPLRDMQVIPPGPGQLRENEDRDIVPWKVRFAPEWDPVVQSTVGGKEGPGGTEIAGPIVSFNAQSNTSGVAPPDPNGAVGPNHIVAMCNLSFQIFNKTGTSLFGPAANNTLWAGFGGACQIENCRRSSGALRSSWPIAGFSRSSLPRARLFSSALPFRKPPIPREPTFGMPSADGDQFPGLPEGRRLAGCLLY